MVILPIITIEVVVVEVVVDNTKGELEIKVLFLKHDGFVRPDNKTRARPLFKWNDEGIARVISCKNKGHVHVISGRTNHLALKTIPLSSFLNTFKNK